MLMPYQEVFTRRVSGNLDKLIATICLGKAISKEGAARNVVLNRVMLTMQDAFQGKGAGQIGALIDPEKQQLLTYYEADIPHARTTAEEKAIIAALLDEAGGQWTFRIPPNERSFDIISAALQYK